MKNLQLICVGYAGSVASNFNILLPYFEENIEFVTVEYKGRGTRAKETKYTDTSDLVYDVAQQVKLLRNTEVPYAILGYSMGAQVVYEMYAQGLLDEKPICTFVAAHEPPDIECAGKHVNLEDEAVFLEQLKVYGGMDERLLKDARFVKIYGSRMKDDFKLLQEYQFSGVYHKLLSRVVMLYCEKDTPYAKVQNWRNFSDDIMFYELGENHFFFKNHPEEFCNIISKEIRG